MKYAVVDLSNLFHRARHAAMTDTRGKVGMALLILFRSLRTITRTLGTDHIVFAVDQSSWRYGVYPGYKARRKLTRIEAPPTIQAEDQMFFGALQELVTYLTDSTRCTVLCAPDIEGDDFVARWVWQHPDDDHVIVSGDSDFVQLLGPHIRIYDAINQRLIGPEAITDEKGRTLEFSVNPKDGKIKVGKPMRDFIPETAWWRKALFIKLILGDTGDSIFAAFPGVRYEGKTCSIRAAWEDRADQGYDWNNLMQQTWDKLVGVAPTGERLVETVLVQDQFRQNERLIDLTQQPPAIKAQMDASIGAAITKPAPMQIGIEFLRFCKRQDLPSLMKEAEDHVGYLNAGYDVSVLATA